MRTRYHWPVLIFITNCKETHCIRSSFSNVEAARAICAAVAGKQVGICSARQFPNISGYNKDAATGVIASAITFAVSVIDSWEVPMKSKMEQWVSLSSIVRFSKATLPICCLNSSPKTMVRSCRGKCARATNSESYVYTDRQTISMQRPRRV